VTEKPVLAGQSGVNFSKANSDCGACIVFDVLRKIRIGNSYATPFSDDGRGSCFV